MPFSVTTDNQAGTAILKVLQYYSLFHYPLTAEEIRGNADIKCSLASVQSELDTLLAAGTVYEYNGYYAISENIAACVQKRLEGNRYAQQKMKGALRVGRFIYSFPFVRFVGISGSLSKGYSDKKSDFDFFVVTECNRLWVCRSLLHLFKKATFLVGQQHSFCMNYFIDTSDLEIEEKNRFTAIELLSLVPVSGSNLHAQLMAANGWKDAHFPNGFKEFYKADGIGKDAPGPLKRIAELALNSMSPLWLNQKLMALTDKKWRRKWAAKGFPMEHYDIAFKTTLHVSKNHPANHQQRVLKAIAKFNNEGRLSTSS